jgi:hypothetical protein
MLCGGCAPGGSGWGVDGNGLKSMFSVVACQALSIPFALTPEILPIAKLEMRNNAATATMSRHIVNVSCYSPSLTA